MYDNVLLQWTKWNVKSRGNVLSKVSILFSKSFILKGNYFSLGNIDVKR